MASTTSNELASSTILTRNGSMRVTVLDRVGPDRLYLMLLRGSIAAQYGRKSDQTGLVPRSLKDLVINPFAEV